MYGANNYGYNPYGTYMPQRQMEQQVPTQMSPPFNSVQSRPVINGKLVDNIEVVRALDIPLDGSISYFPLTDNSAIVTKQLGMNGSSKITIYKPIQDEKEQSSKFVTFEEIDDLKEQIEDLKQEIKELKKKKKSDLNE